MTDVSVKSEEKSETVYAEKEDISVKGKIPLESQTQKVKTPLGIKKQSSFFSIKETLHSTKEVKDDNAGLDSSQKDKDDFSEEQVIIFWQQYLGQLKESEPILYSVLNATSCRVKDKNIIFFEFPSNSAYDEFDSLREDIFQRLKKQLNNYSIEFGYEIKETQKTILLTNKDKYTKMLKINPLLEKLRNDFRLDI